MWVFQLQRQLKSEKKRKSIWQLVARSGQMRLGWQTPSPRHWWPDRPPFSCKKTSAACGRDSCPHHFFFMSVHPTAQGQNRLLAKPHLIVARPGNFFFIQSGYLCVCLYIYIYRYNIWALIWLQSLCQIVCLLEIHSHLSGELSRVQLPFFEKASITG